MSGLTLAVGPRPGEVRDRANDEGGSRGLMGSVRTIELQLVAFILVFSASGLVPLMDLLFPLLVSAYIFLISKIVFPSYQMEGSRLEVFRGSRMFQFYVVLGTMIGLFLPLGYVLGGFARGDQHAVRAATPHLFLLSCQVLSENIISGFSVFSPPVRAVLTMIYTARRLFSLSDWVNDVYFSKTLPSEPSFKDICWIWFGRGLALANLIYFAINMFCFLIPRFLPRAFERYLAAKAAHNVRVTQGQPSNASPSAMVTPDQTHSAPIKDKVEKKTD